MHFVSIEVIQRMQGEGKNNKILSCYSTDNSKLLTSNMLLVLHFLP